MVRGQREFLLQPVPMGAALLWPAGSWGSTLEQLFVLSSSPVAWLSGAEDFNCPPLAVLGFGELWQPFVPYWAPLPAAGAAISGAYSTMC